MVLVDDIQTKGIFVIHAEKDNTILFELRDYFKKQHFFDKNTDKLTKIKIDYLDSKDNTYTGQDFGEVIRKKFEDCYYYLIILTENSRDRPWVNQEIGYAFSKSHEKILVLLDRRLYGNSFGFIHTNYDSVMFDYDNFSIAEDGVEIKKIIQRIEVTFGKKIPNSYITLASIPEKDSLGEIRSNA